MNDAIKRNLFALKAFVAQAERSFRKKDLEGLKHDLDQVRGRLNNLFTILEDLENGSLSESQVKKQLKELEK